jgi:hypothetical protein
MSLFLIVAICTLVGFLGVLVLTHFKTPVDRRPVVRWLVTGGMLPALSNLLEQIASQQGWTLHYSALGAAVLLLDLAGLACLAKAIFSLWRWRRAGRQRI